MFIRLVLVTAFSVLASGMTAATAVAVPIEIGTLNGVRDLGRAPASVRVQIAVVLNASHEAELDRLVDGQADPGSRFYHRFLTAPQYRAYFSPTPADYGRVLSALQRGGFTITHTFANNTVIDAFASAPVAARYFNTDIHRVLSPDMGLTYTNVRAGFVPRDIAGFTLAVFGLDNAHAFHAHPNTLQPGSTRPIRRDLRRNGDPLFGPDGGYGPQIFVQSYDLPAANGITGTDRSSGVLMDGDFLDTDLATYLAYFGVSRTGPQSSRIAVDGGAPPFPGGDAGETTLDVQTIVSLAPGTALYVYELPSLTDRPLIDAYNRAVNDNLVDVLNSSWYGCERQGVGDLAKSIDAIEKQGTAEGMTFSAITGDRGVYTPLCKTMSVAIPASTPHSVAVGGTRLAVDPNTGDETSEVGWNDPGGGATGGGVSVIFRVPAYQRHVPNLIRSGRNTPDVAFDASSATGESEFVNGNWGGPVGGTSLSSPIFSAAMTEIDQLQNSRSGNFNVTLYKTWLASGYGIGSLLYFRDVVQGSIPPYYAKVGYDQMTGIGAMQASNFTGLLPR